ncbi:hypothetical protein F4604DRAFT_1877393 [Suillus subluteus]|nr:hypothetical protein F4604DRAFT_1877393 [Suillus subluteus]
MATCASTPFDHAQADVILRTADGVEFRVFKLFLSLASPFFETLFSLPQAPDGATDQEMKDGLAVIADSFLRFCYPSTLADDPSLENLTDVLSMLSAARKYSLDLIEKKTEPIRCFAVARNAQLKHETITAARHTLRQPLIPTQFSEIGLITCDLKWLTDHYVNCNSCTWLFGPYYNVSCGCGQATDSKFLLWGMHTVTWWATYVQELSQLLMDRPSGETVRTAADRTIQAVRNRAGDGLLTDLISEVMYSM